MMFGKATSIFIFFFWSTKESRLDYKLIDLRRADVMARKKIRYFTPHTSPFYFILYLIFIFHYFYFLFFLISHFIMLGKQHLLLLCGESFFISKWIFGGFWWVDNLGFLVYFIKKLFKFNLILWQTYEPPTSLMCVRYMKMKNALYEIFCLLLHSCCLSFLISRVFLVRRLKKERKSENFTFFYPSYKTLKSEI
jgi:hypothetical protein